MHWINKLSCKANRRGKVKTEKNMIYINILYSRLIEGKDETGKRLALDKQVTCKTTRKSKKKELALD